MLYRSAVLGCVFTLLAPTAPPRASAQITDDFQDGSAQGWQWGPAAPGPTAVPNAGPRGAGDFALRVSTDGAAAGGRLIIYQRAARWIGSWTAAGRDSVTFRMLNDSGNTLTMRVAIEGGGALNQWCSVGVSVPSSASWQTVTIPTAAGDFTRVGSGTNLPGALADVTTVRILHNPVAAWRSVNIVGTFLFDDVADHPLGGYCGDGTLDPSEDCEGANLDGGTCLNQGFSAGTLACGAGCVYDTSGCSTCGNDVREGAEVCDGTSLGGATCVSRGFDGGTLSCNGSCSAFVTAACTDCGDGVREGAEVCDGTDLGTATCANQGFGSGTLRCNASCTAFDASMCTSCGNGAIDAGEVCDGANLGGQSCASRGFAGGALACDACAAFDTSGCFACGDGVINGTETCDGAALGGETCTSLGYDDGVLGCQPGCAAYDPTGCATCGDGVCASTETDASCAADCLLIDRFTDGAVAGWRTGSEGPQPTVEADRGPETAGDNALVVVPAGSMSRLVVFNDTRWTGDFAGRGWDAVHMHVANLGPEPVSLRLAIDGAGGRFVTGPTALPPSGTFQTLRFALSASNLFAAGGTDVDATLGAITMTRLLHATAAQFTGETVDATLVLDNISVQPLAPLCGDGRVNGAESCDDGGRVDDDGCDASCVAELCGDGLVQAPTGEECDDGPDNSDLEPDACRTSCLMAHCGDGVIDTGEACDTVVTSGETCESEGFSGGVLRCADDCLGTDTSACRGGCGDGSLDDDEQCDDGNVESGDGCSATCSLEGGVDGGLADGGSELDVGGGCGCHASRRDASLAGWLGLALALWVGWRRRR